MHPMFPLYHRRDLKLSLSFHRRTMATGITVRDPRIHARSIDMHGMSIDRT